MAAVHSLLSDEQWRPVDLKTILQRALTANGAAFRSLLAEVRFDMARGLLSGTGLPVSDIAEQLGYSESAAFVRAFKGWAGITPAQWRKREKNID